jgi:cellulose synthase/poly-beta-1,6-N-acetylglucosamine synthase-like glycosyltransferase
MEIVDSKDVKVSLKSIVKFPLIVLCLSLLFFSLAYFFFFGVFQVVLYINTVFMVIGIIYTILFGLIPLFIKRDRKSPNLCQIQQLVSIVIPVFNDCGILEKNLQNLLKLDYSNFEILVVYSTKSTDRTEGVALNYASEYPHKVRAIPENVSKGNALNVGTANARGEIILVLDSDTFIHNGFIERAMSYFVDEKVKSVSSVWLGMNATQNLVTLVQFAMTSNMNFYSTNMAKYLNNVGFCGFGVFLRKSAILECNGFSTVASEEAEFTYRSNKLFPKWRGILDDQLFCYQYFTPSMISLYLQQMRWTKGNWKFNLKSLRNTFSQSIERRFIGISTFLMVIIFPLFGLLTMGMSIVQFFANFFVQNLSFGGGLFFFLISQVSLFFGFAILLVFIYPKYRGESAVMLPRKTIFIAVFLIMFVCGFIYGIVALNSLKELITQKKEVFVKVDKSNILSL